MYDAFPPSVVLNASTIDISFPSCISLSRSQQNPSFAFGPTNRSPSLSPLGSLDGSGKEALCVGGGEPDADDRRDERGRWIGEAVPAEKGSCGSGGDSDGSGELRGDGEAANGSGVEFIVVSLFRAD